MRQLGYSYSVGRHCRTPGVYISVRLLTGVGEGNRDRNRTSLNWNPGCYTRFVTSQHSTGFIFCRPIRVIVHATNRDARTRCNGEVKMHTTIRLAILISLAGLSLAFGQTSGMNGEITGTITDPSGAAIPYAVVSVTNTGTGFRQTGKTRDTGLYRFNLLPLGTYDVEVEAVGFVTGQRSGIEVNAGASVTLNVPMAVAGSTTQVDVTTAGTATDPARTDLGTTLDNNATRNLPLV